MGNKSISLQIQLVPSQDYLLIQWLVVMSKRRPRYASVYAREALRHYILTHEYMHLGSVMVVKDDLSQKKQVLSIIKDETISQWIDSLADTKMKAGPFARAILSKCIQESTDGEDHIPDLIDIIEQRTSSGSGGAPALKETPASQEKKVTSNSDSQANNSAQSINPPQSINKKPETSKSDNTKRTKQSLIGMIGGQLEKKS